jgi:hypothetical protein
MLCLYDRFYVPNAATVHSFSHKIYANGCDEAKGCRVSHIRDIDFDVTANDVTNIKLFNALPAIGSGQVNRYQQSIETVSVDNTVIPSHQ